MNMYVYIYEFQQQGLCIRIFMYPYMHVYTYVYIIIYICMYMYICIYMNTFTNMDTYNIHGDTHVKILEVSCIAILWFRCGDKLIISIFWFF